MATLTNVAKHVGKRMLAGFGLHVSRGPGNRFDVMDHTIAQLRMRGYTPAIVIDGGANVGRWTELAHTIFPDATYFLVEPQPACLPALDLVSRRVRSAQVFNYALTEPGNETITMLGADPESKSEGAWIPVSRNAETNGLKVPATTLDALFAHRFRRENRVFLKLDLEGYEYNALLGAAQLLKSVEVILCELRFYDVEHSGHQTFGDVAALLRSHGFLVYDFARLIPRLRDGRLYFGDVLFVRHDSELAEDVSWP